MNEVIVCSRIRSLLLAAVMVALVSCGGSEQGSNGRLVEEGLLAYQEGRLADAKLAWMTAAKTGSADANYYLGVLNNEGFEGGASEAARWFELAAAQGHVKAQYNLALAYERGLGVLRNRDTAIEWLEKAAGAGDTDAQYMLGLLLLDGGESGPSDSAQRGIELLAAAAEAGHGLAQLALGNAYLRGESVARDPPQAEIWLSRALQSGLVQALRPLLAAKAQVRRTEPQSRGELEDAAERGDAAAQHRLAVELLSEDRSESQMRRAEHWLGKAAAADYPEAQYDLGLMLVDGTRSQEGVQWIFRAAEAGLAAAQYAAGLFHAEGRLVPKDEAKAYRWYGLAAAQGMASAQHALGYALVEGVGVQQDQAAAMEWFKRAAENGHHESALRVSNMYANGEGVGKDPHEVMRWECRAFVLGNHVATSSLARYGDPETVCGEYAEDLAAFVAAVLGSGDEASLPTN